MAVEDHPDYQEWSDAFDDVDKIKLELEGIPKYASGPEKIRRDELRKSLEVALRKLNAVAAKIQV